ncbi:GntR family transcriptional regulator [Nocardia alni]|uniref:GntR family transcriptional regulator n=1 Tax=Nocardia alni TaxID=2815723 RepID=UPI001C23F4F2|nr:GntR family transcriptional regulator [Nocardia alni]
MSLSETVYHRLRAEIIDCRLAPGQRLTERGLAADTGFGISPIREALARLAHDGLVISTVRRGYRVAPLSLKSVDDLFTLWRMVGPEIARLGVQQATPEQLVRIKTLFASISDPTRRAPTTAEESLRRVEIANATFDVLADATTNDFLIVLYHKISGHMSRTWQLVYAHDLEDSLSFAAEDRWGEILRNRDGGTAADFAHAFIEQTHERILRILSRWPSVLSSEVRPVRTVDQSGSVEG